MSASNEQIQKIMLELRNEYVGRLPEKMERLESLFKEHNHVELETEFHKMKGTGKTYGLPEVSSLGLVFENVCKNSSLSADHLHLAIEWLSQIFESRQKSQEFAIESLPVFLELKKKYVPKESTIK